MATAEQYKRTYIDYVTRMANKAAAEHPRIPIEVFNDIVSEYEKGFDTFQQQMMAVEKSPPIGPDGKINFGVKRYRQKQIENAYYAQIENAIVAKHGKDGKSALTAVGDEMRGPSLLGGLFKLVWDSSKGGLQVGGILGIIAGYFAGSKVVAAAGGGWFGMLALAATALVGGWLGKGAGEMIKNAVHSPRPGQPEMVKNPPLPAHKPEKENPINEDVKNKATETPAPQLPPAEEVGRENSGTLPFQPSGPIKPVTPEKNAPNKPDIGSFGP